jgi:hypothetical protein
VEMMLSFVLVFHSLWNNAESVKSTLYYDNFCYFERLFYVVMVVYIVVLFLYVS